MLTDKIHNSHLTFFNTNNDYDNFLNGDKLVKPNVSYIKENKGVRYHKKFIPEPENPDVNLNPKAILTFNATEDNLLAFENINSNIKSISVDGVNVEFDEFVENENVSYITADMMGGSIPEEVYYKTSTSFKMEVVNEFEMFDLSTTYIMLYLDGEMNNAQPLSEWITQGLCKLENDNTCITFDTDYLNQAVSEIGSFVFVPINYGALSVIEVKQTMVTISGGLREPLKFSTPGEHVVELKLSSPIFNSLLNISSTLLNCCMIDITQLGIGCFMGFQITSIILPNTLKTIGNYAFDNCHSLSSITIPDSVTSIGDGAFYGCSSLSSITIPDSVTTISNATFQGCEGLTSIIIPDSITSIGEYAFDRCSGLTSVTLGSGVTSIGERAFSDCKGLTSITIPDSVISIGASAFAYCSGLTDVSISNNLTYLGNGAFVSCPNLPVVNDIQYADSILVKCQNNSLSTILIKEGTKFIHSNAFANMTGLTTLTIPDEIIFIGSNAFYNCSGLTSITLGAGVEYIGTPIFSACTSLQSLNISPNNKKYDSRDNCNCLIDTTTQTVIAGTNNSFVPYGVEYIADGIFEGSAISTMSLPETLLSIGAKSFKDSNITEIVFPDSLTTIGENAFYGCNNLISVTFGSGLSVVPDTCFYSCDKLDNVLMSDSIVEVGWGGFEFCTGLTSIVLSKNLERIGDYAFQGCDTLQEIHIPENVEYISDTAFRGCETLSAITVSNQNVTYDSKNNSNCIIETSSDTLVKGCKNTVIPNGVKVIGAHSFDGVFNLTSLPLPETVTTINEYAFSNCDHWVTVYIGPGVVTVGNRIFEDADVRVAEFGDSVKSIGDYIFYKNRNLTTVKFGTGLEKLGENVFYECTGVTSITCHAVVAPEITDTTFDYVSSSGTLYYPSGSDYTTWINELPSGWSKITI